MTTADVLGADFETRTLPLGGGSGDVIATLVLHRAQPASKGAILFVHGFADYFFQRHLAEHYAALGYDFYGIDLRAYGRSLRPGQAPNFVADLTEHFEEIDAAVRVIREEHGHQRLVVMGHSTGGLITSLWAHERRADDVLDALVLNSPWLDLAESWLLRTIGTSVVRGAGRLSPKLVIKPNMGPVYGESIHRDHHGEWDFNMAWKPLEAFPVLAGWLRTIRRNHAKLHAGLDVRVPTLVLHSDRSHLHAKAFSAEAMVTDTVLDVEHIARWAPKLGRQVTSVAIAGGMHDLLLSAEPVRDKAFGEIDAFLDTHTRA